jgi:hypothetical protein
MTITPEELYSAISGKTRIRYHEHFRPSSEGSQLNIVTVTLCVAWTDGERWVDDPPMWYCIGRLTADYDCYGERRGGLLGRLQFDDGMVMMRRQEACVRILTEWQSVCPQWLSDWPFVGWIDDTRPNSAQHSRKLDPHDYWVQRAIAVMHGLYNYSGEMTMSSQLGRFLSRLDGEMVKLGIRP